jgi:tripartite-type tricarboxylate transporter receptor subunit TctC
MNTVFSFLINVFAGLTFALYSSAAAFGQDFYNGKTVRFVVGSPPGGGFDIYTRTIARHIINHIPGNPTTIVENMPGAGNLVCANYMYNRANPDGLTIGHCTAVLILQQVLGQKGIQFDARKFEWIGVPAPAQQACVLSKSSGVTNINEWFMSKRPLKLGGQAPGTLISDLPRLMSALLGLPIHLVEGYGGSNPIRLAVEAGELDGGCWTTDVIIKYWRQQLSKGDLNIVLQANTKKHPALPTVPNVMDFAKTPEDRQLIRTVQNAQEVLFSYSSPPGTPRERYTILRHAFMATMKDPAFLAEAKKTELAIDPSDGERVATLVDEIFALKPDLVTKLKNILITR